MSIFMGPGEHGTKSNNPYKPGSSDYNGYNQAVESRDRMKRAVGEKVPGDNGCATVLLFFMVLLIGGIALL